MLTVEHNLIEPAKVSGPSETRFPHRLVFGEFCKAATLVPLTGCPRAGRVYWNGRDLGYVDALGEAGLRQAHEREVNNALFAHMPSAPDFMRDIPLPSTEVLAEYPTVVARFPGVDLTFADAGGARQA